MKSQCSLDLALLWLWCRPAAIAPIGPLAWELPYAGVAALKSNKQTNKKSEWMKQLFGPVPVTGVEAWSRAPSAIWWQMGSVSFWMYLVLDLKTTTITKTSCIALNYNVLSLLLHGKNGADKVIAYYIIKFLLSFYILLSILSGM